MRVYVYACMYVYVHVCISVSVYFFYLYALILSRTVMTVPKVSLISKVLALREIIISIPK